jgi:hypothetical protein
MGILRFSLSWTFIFAVAAYDVYFAWQYRAVFRTWEMNPGARWVAGVGGLGAVFGAKAILLCFAAGVGACCYRNRHWLSTPYTGFVLAVHLLLSLQYVLGHFWARFSN